MVRIDDIMCDEITCEHLHVASVTGLGVITCEDLHLASVVGMDDITRDDLTYDDLNLEFVRLWVGLTI